MPTWILPSVCAGIWLRERPAGTVRRPVETSIEDPLDGMNHNPAPRVPTQVVNDRRVGIHFRFPAGSSAAGRTLCFCWATLPFKKYKISAAPMGGRIQSSHGYLRIPRGWASQSPSRKWTLPQPANLSHRKGLTVCFASRSYSGPKASIHRWNLLWFLVRWWIDRYFHHEGYPLAFLSCGSQRIPILNPSAPACFEYLPAGSSQTLLTDRLPSLS